VEGRLFVKGTRSLVDEGGDAYDEGEGMWCVRAAHDYGDDVDMHSGSM
jgi:hypothetical protein